MSKALDPLYEIVAWMVLLLGIVGMILSFGLLWDVPVTVAAFFKTVGIVSLLAVFSEMFRRPIWGKWGFAVLFGLVAYRTLTSDYEAYVVDPHSTEAAVGLAVIGVVFGFGAAHLGALPKGR